MQQTSRSLGPAVLPASSAVESVKNWDIMSKQHLAGVYWHMVGWDVLPCPWVLGRVSGQGLAEPQPRQGRCWQHLLPALPLQGGSAELSSPLPAPRPCSCSAAGSRLPTRALQLCSFHPGGGQDRAAPLPPAAKGILHGHTSHPSRGERASQQSILDPASMW